MTDDQSMVRMLNDCLSSVFNTTSVGDSINTNDINTNEATTSASVVGSQDATTELRDNSNGSVSNNNENVLDQQNCFHENVISPEHTLQNFEIITEDVLNSHNNMKTNETPWPDNIYPKILKETKNEIVNTLTSSNLGSKVMCTTGSKTG